MAFLQSISEAISNFTAALPNTGHDIVGNFTAHIPVLSTEAIANLTAGIPKLSNEVMANLSAMLPISLSTTALTNLTVSLPNVNDELLPDLAALVPNISTGALADLTTSIPTFANELLSNLTAIIPDMNPTTLAILKLDIPHPDSAFWANLGASIQNLSSEGWANITANSPHPGGSDLISNLTTHLSSTLDAETVKSLAASISNLSSDDLVAFANGTLLPFAEHTLNVTAEYVQANPVQVALLGVSLAFLGVGPAINVVGFTPAGIAPRSLAALWQSSLPLVSKGSLVAGLQSTGAGGTQVIPVSNVLGGVVAGLAIFGEKILQAVNGTLGRDG